MLVAAVNSGVRIVDQSLFGIEPGESSASATVGANT
jgi:hypothetical protein